MPQPTILVGPTDQLQLEALFLECVKAGVGSARGMRGEHRRRPIGLYAAINRPLGLAISLLWHGLVMSPRQRGGSEATEATGIRSMGMCSNEAS